MGFEINRFQGDVDAELICPICSGVLEDPLQAPACEHAFCRACITKWISCQPTCPVDRQPVTASQLRPVPRIIRNFLSRLRTSCDNAPYGCNAVLNLDSLASHLVECSLNSGTATASPFGGLRPTSPTTGTSASVAATSTPSTTSGDVFGTSNTTRGISGGSTSGFGFGAAQSADSGYLFGNTTALGRRLFGTTHNQTAFAAKPTGVSSPGFGFGGTTTNGPLTGINFGSTPSRRTGLMFSNNTASLFGQQQQQSGTAHVKYKPVVGTDVVEKSGTSQTVNIKHQCITCMKDYENKSLEELRLEDYVADRKGITRAVFGGFQQQTQNKPLRAGNTLFGGGTTRSFAAQPSCFSFANNAQSTNTTGLFGANKPAFGAAPTTGLFGAATTQSQASIFGTNTSTLGFGATTQKQPLFGGATTGLGSSGATTGFGSSGATTGLGSNGATTGLGSSGATTGFGSSGATTGLGSSGATTGLGSSGATTGLGSSGATTGLGSSGPTMGLGSSGATMGLGSSGPTMELGSSEATTGLASSGGTTGLGSSGAFGANRQVFVTPAPGEFNPKRPMPCEAGCGIVIPKDELAEHNCVRELRALIATQQGKLNDYEQELAEHKRTHQEKLNDYEQELAEHKRTHQEKLNDYEQELAEHKRTHQEKLNDYEQELAEHKRTHQEKLNDYEQELAEHKRTHQGKLNDHEQELAEHKRELELLKKFMRDQMEQKEVVRWANSLARATVTDWDARLMSPGDDLQMKIRGSLSESGCPPHIIDYLMENYQEQRWPPGILSSFATNTRLLEKYVCKRVPGHQAVLVLHCDNTHMDECMIKEPGFVVIFRNGVE